MIDLAPKPVLGTPRANYAAQSQQPRRLLLALVLLLVALAGILIKDRQFWFGSDQLQLDSESGSASVASQASVVAPSATKAARPASAHKQVLRTLAETSNTPLAAPSAPSDAPVVARTVLPPLDVEVVAGNTHRTVHPRSNITKVELTDSNSFRYTQTPDVTNASQREPIADQSEAYPLLAQHMNVQGSVVMQALIGADGVVENLRVLSGPAILANAAQQAVREWRFKPILQNGQAVESKARITVSFTIKVADNAPKTTIADSRIEGAQLVTR